MSEEKMRLKNYLPLLLLCNSFHAKACYPDLSSASCSPSFSLVIASCDFGNGTVTPYYNCIPDEFTGSLRATTLCIAGRAFASQQRNCFADQPLPVVTESSPNDSACAKGSIIDVDTRTVSETIPLVGVPFSLVYSSNKVKGRRDWFSRKIPL